MVLSSAIVCDHDRRIADDRRSVFPYDRRRSQNFLRSAIIWKPALSSLFPAETDVLVPVLSRSTDVVVVNFVVVLKFPIFFTDDAAKKFFPTSKISAQEIGYSPSVFPYLVNLTIMAHIMGLGNQSESWKIIIMS